MMKHWSFYSLTDGRFAERAFASSDHSLINANTPVGHIAIEGQFDPLSQRFDLETQQVVDYQPPQPSADHEWNATTRRWQLTAGAAVALTRRLSAEARIDELERKQLRAIREQALGYDGAKARVQAIDDEIAKLRSDLG